MGLGFLNSCKDLLGALTSKSQNGKSAWGTLAAPTLPLWIISQGGHGGHEAGPWGDRTAINSNPYTDAPDTGITRTYEFSISRGVIAPDGYQKSVLLVNEQYPGPLIEANWGDWIEVKVNNDITDDPPEGTAIHWHGFLQMRTPWMDGVPGVTQCPIAPGKSLTYKFRADVYGTSWYHSHYSAQYSGGLYGPMVIYGPTNVDYDIDVGPIMVNDWWHEDYFTIVKEVMSPGFSGQTFSDNNLINGRMNFDCAAAAEAVVVARAAGDNNNTNTNNTNHSYNNTHNTKCTDNAGLSKFRFKRGKAHRLRFINSGSGGVERISLDEHTMTVMAQDFVPIEPYDTTVVTLGVGQRVDVVVRALSSPSPSPSPTQNATSKKKPSAFWLRANLTSCSLANQPYALAAVYYDDAKEDTNAIPDSEAWDVPDPGTCANDDLALTRPYYPIRLPEPSWTQNMDIDTFRNESGNFLWTFGGVTARVNYNDPSLLQVAKGDLEFGPTANIQNYGTNASVRFIVNNPTKAPHPMHAHGLNMYILAAGPGSFDASAPGSAASIESLADNPPRRDVQNVQPNGHIVVQMDVANPGLWPFHCHTAWHSSAGFFSQMLFLPDEVAGYSVPDSVGRTCAEWREYTASGEDVVDQIDSGL